jgi:hypothetical protein
MTRYTRLRFAGALPSAWVLPARDSPHTGIAVGRHVGNTTFISASSASSRGAASALWRAPGRPRNIGVCDADRLADGFHREPSFGNDSDRKRFFWTRRDLQRFLDPRV